MIIGFPSTSLHRPHPRSSLPSFLFSSSNEARRRASLTPSLLSHRFSQYPTLTQEGFFTEVHHINGLGENAGVVYAEMQARENQSGDLMALKFVSSLFLFRPSLLLTRRPSFLQDAAIDLPFQERLPI